MSGSEIVRMAKEQLVELTGLQADTVSGLQHEDDGWHVTIELVDLKRIPESSDVLDTYDVLLDDTGMLINYQRVRRYLRGETMEMEPAGEKRGG